MKGLSVIVLFWLIFSTSCDPCDNCGEPLVFEPTVALVFINNDTLEKLTTVIEYVTDSLDRTETQETIAENELDSLEARLNVVNDSIENGNTSYEAEKDDLEELINTYADSLVYYTLLADDIDSIADYFVAKRTDVLNGLLRVDTLFINDQYLTFSDSFEIYDAPLLMNEESFTQFEVVIGDFRGEVAFDYNLIESVDATREIKLRASDIFPVNYVAFDSISDPDCETPQCFDHETTVYLYFQ